MEKISYYTEAGLQKLKDELHALKIKGRATVAEQLAEARDKGDLSENAEYDAAKNSQGLLEMKISTLEQIVAKARVISKADVDTSQVSILTTVKIKNTKQGKTFTYTIVAEEEADLKAGKISIESPIGKGLLGKKVGEVASIKVPVGDLEFEILEIGLSCL
jgi:transcription elongation factor GreA